MGKRLGDPAIELTPMALHCAYRVQGESRRHAATQKTQRSDHSRAGRVTVGLRRTDAAARRVHLARRLPARLADGGPVPARDRQPALAQLVLRPRLLRRLLRQRRAETEPECDRGLPHPARLDGARRVRLDLALLFLGKLVRREREVPRPDWRRRCEEDGFGFHSMGGVYWDESACYAFDAAQIDRLEEVTGELHALCLKI